MTAKYNPKEKLARRKAKERRKKERVREAIAKAVKNKPHKEEKQSNEG